MQCRCNLRKTKLNFDMSLALLQPQLVWFSYDTDTYTVEFTQNTGTLCNSIIILIHTLCNWMRIFIHTQSPWILVLMHTSCDLIRILIHTMRDYHLNIYHLMVSKYSIKGYWYKKVTNNRVKTHSKRCKMKIEAIF